MKDQVDVLPKEQSSGLELVAQGATLVRLENNTQMAIAVQRPRNEALILAASLKELDLYPSMAKEALYNKPVGKDDTGDMKYAEGLSIRAAESLANRWDNSSYASLIEEDDPEKDYAVIAGVFLDYEKNTRHVAEARVSRFYKNRQGQVIRFAPDRFDTNVKAQQSKVLREVLLRSLPAGLKKEYENRVRKILKGDSAANLKTALLERLQDIKVTQARVEAFKGKKIGDMKKEELTELIGMANAIRDGEATADDVFGQLKPQSESDGLGLKVQS